MSGAQRTMRRGAFALAATWAIVALVASRASSQSPTPVVTPSPAVAPAPAASPAVDYRRIFVPTDRPDEWPTDGQPYLPIDRAEFERLVNAAEEQSQLGAAGGVQLQSARYSARLANHGTLEGDAELQFHLVDELPRLFPFAPWNGVVHDAHWTGPGVESTDEIDQAAEADSPFGLWTRPGESAPTYGVLVPRSGTLAVDWSLPARSVAGANSEFVLQLPNALSQLVTVDLPTGATATLSGARLLGKTEIANPSFTRWTFQFAPQAEHRLRIRGTASEAPPVPSSLPILAVSGAYALTADGLNYEAELRVQERGATLGELRLTTPADLRIIEVLVDRQPIVWRRDQEDATALIIPIPSSATPVTVTIRGAAALVLDAPWQLPDISASGVFWSEGTSTLWVDPSLEVESIVPREASLLNLIGVGGPNDGGEVYRLQAWSSAASTELIVGERAAHLRSHSGVTAEFSDRELSARCQAVVWAERGRAFHVEAKLEPEWTLESVTATPAETLVEWHVSEGPQRRLQLQLRRSPTESEPLRLTIAGRKPLRGWAQAATLAELELVSFPDAQQVERLVLVKDRRSGELLPDRRLAEAILAPAALNPDQRSLVAEPTAGLLFDARKTEGAAAIRVIQIPARFSGEGWMELVGAATGFEHRAEILCRPAVGAIGELTVAAARPLPADARWEMVGEAEEPLVEPIKLPEPGSASTVGAALSSPGGEYHVRLARSHAEPFRLRVSWRGDQRDADRVNALTLPGAENWQSWAILRGNPETVAVDPHGCQAAAAAPRQFGRDDGLAVVGCYRLGDDPTMPLAATPSLVASPAAPAIAGKQRGVIGWLCELSTHQFADGRQSNRILYRLEAHGADEVFLTLPPRAAFAAARIDGAPAAIEPVAKESNQIHVPLPVGRANVTLEVEYDSERASLERSDVIAPPLPETSFAVLRGRWTLWSPVRYAAEEPSATGANDACLPRLLGPLAGTSGVASMAGFGASDVHADDDNGPAPPPRSSSLPGGWSTYSQEFVAAPLPIKLKRVDGDRALWHVAWLLAAIAAAWAWPRYPRIIALLAVMAAVACLVLPQGLVTVPQAVLLGMFTGIAVRQLALATRGNDQAQARAARAAAAIVLAITVASSSAPASAAEPAFALPPNVLYPIDANGNSAGADVYAPASLVAELVPADPAVPSGGAIATLVDAAYQLTLQQDPASGVVASQPCILHFRWRTFQPNARLELPLQPSDAQWPASQQSLDGAPVQLQWNPSSDGCAITVAAPGVHELQLVAIPQVERLGGRNRLRLHLPPIPGATVEINHPAALTDLKIPASTPTASSPTRIVVRLAATEMLEATWPERLRTAAEAVRVDQLSWLEVDPAAARLEVRLRLTGDAATLQTLRLAVSPQLKLLPLPENSPLQELPATSAAATVVELKFRTPPTLPLTIPLQFQLQRTLSVGRLDFPAVTPLGLDVGTRHFAVSADRRLRIRDEAGSGLSPVTPAEIEAEWGAALGIPTLQYAVAAEQPNWSLHVEPAAPRFTPRESLDLLCDPEEVQASYSAAVAAVDGEILIHRLAIPPEMIVTDVSVAVDGPDGSVLVRWSRPRSDQLCLYLGRPLSEPHSVRVEATVPYRDQRRLAIPRIGLENNLTAPIDLVITRSSDVLVAWAEPAAAPKLATASSVGLPSAKLLVGRYALSRNSAPLPELQISANEAQFSADVAVSLNLAPAEPTAICTLRGNVSRGVVDSVRLITGKNWRGPFNAAGGAAVTRRDLPFDASRQVIEVRLAKPVAAGEQFTLQLTGPISLEVDQRVRFPTARVINAEPQRTYLVLPETTGNQTAEWTLRGLRREPLPQSLADALQLTEPIAYRIERDLFIAEQRLFPDAMRLAASRLVETRVAIDGQGRRTAVSQLIIQAGGGGACEICLPKGAELTYAAVDDRPVARPVVRDGVWQPPAGSRYLPQVFTLAYRLPSTGPNARLRLEPPQALVEGEPLVPARSLWQVVGGDAGSFAAVDARQSLGPTPFAAVVRQAQIAAVLDASPLASQLPEWESRQWYEPWLARLGAKTDELDAAATEPARAAEWIKLRERLIAAAPASPRLPDSSKLALRHFGEAGETSAWYDGDAAGGLTLLAAATGNDYSRWFVALAIVGMSGAAWRYSASLEPIVAAARRWPSAIGIALGLLWWLALTPSLVGLAIAALSLAALIKQRHTPRL